MRSPPDPASRPAAASQRDLLLPGVLLFTAGALAVLALPRLPPLAWLAGLSLPALIPWRGRALYAALALGVLLTVWRAQGMIEQRWPLADSDQERVVQGRIASLPEQRLSPGQHEDAAEESEGDDAQAPPQRDWRFVFAPDDAALPRLIRVSWYHAAQAPRGGDCWSLRLRLRAPHGPLNANGFDYEAWLFEQGIGATGTVREAQPCAVQGGYYILRARQRIADRLEQWLTGDPALGLAAGLVVGDRGLLQQRDWDTFRVTGTSQPNTFRLSSCRLAISS